ncbi:MAG: PH domain-containing protein [Candidatus Hydrogenedentota bacterium]
MTAQIRERILQEAAFSPNAVTYRVLATAIVCAASVVGIPFLVFVPFVASWYWGRYYQNLRVVLTSRDLKVFRGIWMREEKTIPLEKITDLRVYQGPVMRRLGLKGLAVETAGSSGQQGGALVTVIGIENTDDFRDTALNQRDRITDQQDAASPSAAPTAPQPAVNEVTALETLNAIHETLRRIEDRLSREP